MGKKYTKILFGNRTFGEFALLPPPSGCWLCQKSYWWDSDHGSPEVLLFSRTCPKSENARTKPSGLQLNRVVLRIQNHRLGKRSPKNMQAQAVTSADRSSIERITSDLTQELMDGPFITPVVSGWGCWGFADARYSQAWPSDLLWLSGRCQGH